MNFVLKNIKFESLGIISVLRYSTQNFKSLNLILCNNIVIIYAVIDK